MAQSDDEWVDRLHAQLDRWIPDVTEYRRRYLHWHKKVVRRVNQEEHLFDRDEFALLCLMLSETPDKRMPYSEIVRQFATDHRTAFVMAVAARIHPIERWELE